MSGSRPPLLFRSPSPRGYGRRHRNSHRLSLGDRHDQANLGRSDAYGGGPAPPRGGPAPLGAGPGRGAAAGPPPLVMSYRFAILIATPPIAGLVIGYLSGGRLRTI